MCISLAFEVVLRAFLSVLRCNVDQEHWAQEQQAAVPTVGDQILDHPPRVRLRTAPLWVEAQRRLDGDGSGKRRGGQKA